MGSPGVKKPPISQAVDEALEARCASERASRHWRRAMADGVITSEEATEGVRLQERALAEAIDVVPLVERACQLVTIGTQFSLYGDATPRSLDNARTVGVYPPTLDDAA